MGESAGGKAHEAGWDAYMTAHIFLKLCGSIDDTTEHPILFSQTSPLFKLWNIINIARSSANMELARDQSKDTAPENVFHVYDFDMKVRTSDIFKWFSDFGKVSVLWKDDNSAFVTINEPEKLEAAREFAERSHDEFEIEPLQTFRNNELKMDETDETPPREPLAHPPQRTRRSSLKRPGKKRPRPSSIGFDDENPSERKKRKKDEDAPQKTFECCIS